MRRRLQHDLHASTVDGSAFSVMVGLGEAYMPAFALAVGLGEVAAGLVASVPILGGALLQLVTPWAVAWLGSLRRWVVLCASVQALSFAPLVLGAVLGRLSPLWLYGSVLVYWAAGFAVGPAWNAWIETLVPRALRPRFFAQRSRWCHGSALAGLVVGGGLLELARRGGVPMAGFAVSFGIAMVARVVSSLALASQGKGRPRSGSLAVESPKRVKSRPLFLYMISLQASVFVAAPFFTPYMLSELELSYAGFTVLTATSFVARIVVLPWLGTHAQGWGARRLMLLGGIGIVPMSAMWTVSDTFGYLLGLQVLSGTAWAAYELGTFLMFFESIPLRRRVAVLTLYNLGHAVAIVMGTLVGGLVLSRMGVGRDAYMMVFLGSSLLRASATLLLLRVPASAVPVKPVPTRVIGVRPGGASFERPVVGSIPQEKVLD